MVAASQATPALSAWRCRRLLEYRRVDAQNRVDVRQLKVDEEAGRRERRTVKGEME